MMSGHCLECGWDVCMCDEIARNIESVGSGAGLCSRCDKIEYLAPNRCVTCALNRDALFDEVVEVLQMATRFSCTDPRRVTSLCGTCFSCRATTLLTKIEEQGGEEK